MRILALSVRDYTEISNTQEIMLDEFSLKRRAKIPATSLTLVKTLVDYKKRNIAIIMLKQVDGSSISITKNFDLMNNEHVYVHTTLLASWFTIYIMNRR
jgi:hypothetical protein